MLWSYEKLMLLKLKKHQQPDINKIYLCIKDPFESMHQLLFNGRERVGIKTLKHLKAFIDYSKTIDDVYENLSIFEWEDALPEKELLEKDATVKIFEYSLLGVELKAQTDIAKN